MPNPDEPFYLETDASNYASGAVLMQKDDNRHLHPCSYLSKTFSKTEQKYPIGNRELLALVRGLDDWRIYLEGAPHVITIYIDHQNLQYFRVAQKLKPRQAHYSLFLSQFNIKLIHKPGKTMTLSDPLSRRADQQDQRVEDIEQTLLPEHLFVNLLETEMTNLLKKANDYDYDPKALEQLKLPDGQTNQEDSPWEVQKIHGEPRLFYREKAYVPNVLELKQKILKEAHDHPTAGHPGTTTTL
jgi:hypothetical protein